MEAVFLKLVNLSLTAGVLILVIFALRLIFRRAPKWIFCLLWGLVALRLVFPFSVESSLSLIPSAEPLPVELLNSDSPQIDTGISVLDNIVNPVIADNFTPEVGASANPLQIWSGVLSLVWIVGFIIMIGYAIISSILLRRKLRTATPYRKGIKRSDAVMSPFVLGIMRPVIYLPYGISDRDLVYVISHEKAHIQRKDNCWKPLGFLILSVYWFNPLCWLAYILLCRDIEGACDEKVINSMDKETLREYSTALLNCSVNRRMIAACPIAFGEIGVKERIKNVMNYKKPAFWIVSLAIAACVVTAVCFLTNPDSADEGVGTITETDEKTTTASVIENMSVQAQTGDLIVDRTIAPEDQDNSRIAAYNKALNINANSVTRITVSNGPSELIVDDEEVEGLINKLNSYGLKDIEDENKKGWQYLITIEMDGGESTQLTFMDSEIRVNGVVYGISGYKSNDFLYLSQPFAGTTEAAKQIEGYYTYFSDGDIAAASEAAKEFFENREETV